MKSHALTRRQVLSATGSAIVSGTILSGSAAANDKTKTYQAILTGDALGVSTAAAGTATATGDPKDGTVSYEIHVSCLRNGTNVVVSIDGGQRVGVLELDGEVTDGLVRDTTIAAGSFDDFEHFDVPEEEIRNALESGDLIVTIETEQNSDGEIEGALKKTKMLNRPTDRDDDDDGGAPVDGPYSVTVNVRGLDDNELLDGEIEFRSIERDERVTAPIKDGVTTFELEGGEYQIYTDVEGYFAVEGVSTFRVTITEDTTIDQILWDGPSDVDLVLTITDAETGEPIEDAFVFGGTYLPGGGDPLFEAYTDENGQIEEEVTDSEWSFEVTADGYRTGRTAADFSDRDGETVEVNIELEPTDDDGVGNGEYQITLDITDAIDGDPIEEGEVTFIHIESGETTTASISGGQAVLNLDAGEYDLNHDVPNYRELEAVTPPELEIDSDETISYSLVRRLEDVTLIVTVEDEETGEPVEGVDVTGFGRHPEYDPLIGGETNADGVAEINAGDTVWEIYLENADGYEQKQVDVDLTNSAGETVEVIYEITPTSSKGEEGVGESHTVTYNIEVRGDVPDDVEIPPLELDIGDEGQASGDWMYDGSTIELAEGTYEFGGNIYPYPREEIASRFSIVESPGTVEIDRDREVSYVLEYEDKEGSRNNPSDNEGQL